MNQRYVHSLQHTGVCAPFRPFLLLLLMFAVLPVYALGLGGPQVHSSLGEPLDVTARLILGAEDEGSLAGVVVRVGDGQLFKRLDLPYRAIYAEITPEVIQRDGQYLVHLSTQHPFVEPFLELPLDIRIGRNHVVRVVTLLVDPPVQTPVTAATPVPAVKPASTPAAAPQALSSAPVAMASLAPRRKAITPRLVGDRYGPVATNETLGDVAQKMGYKGVTFNQKLVALWQTNPKAFLHNNMNYLMAGSTLQLPDRETVLRYPVDKANAEVAAQARGRSGGSVIGGAQSAPRPDASAPSEQEASQTQQADAEAQQEPQRLVIATPKAVEEMPLAVREQFDALYREIDTMEKENSQLRARITNLEEQVAVMSRLVIEAEKQRGIATKGAAQEQGTGSAAGNLQQGEETKPAPLSVEVSREPRQAEETPAEGLTKKTVTYLVVALLFIFGGALAGWWLWYRREQTLSMQRLLR